MRYIFPGKFNPPHLGHALTIMKLVKQFPDLTICVTTDIPEKASFTPEEIAKEMLGFGLPVILFKGTLTKQKENPFRDYTILSGNPDVISWAKKVKAESLFIPRSGDISGTKIRNGNS